MLDQLDYYGMSSKYNCSDDSESSPEAEDTIESHSSEGYTANIDPEPE